MRAIESGRDLLRATNTGITATVSYEGKVLTRAPQFRVATLSAEVTPRTGATPYVRWRDWPILGVIALGLGLLLLRRFRSEEHTSELQSLMRISYAVFCLKKKKTKNRLLTTKTIRDINSMY